MNILHLSIISSLTLLAGCAGMNSQFEFEKPAKDSGYWMNEADNMTQNTPNTPTKRLNLAAYKLIHLANTNTEITTLPTADFDENLILTTKTTSGLNHTTKANHNSDISAPQRKKERITRTWIAPYVSPDEVVHAGEVIYFVSTPANWTNVEER